MKHHNNFDFLRFLFSFLVVVGHTVLLSNKPEFWNNILAAMPNYSVYSFFVISGFLIFSSFERQKSIRKYTINRLKRILPAYILVVVFFAFFLYFFSGVDVTTYFSVEWLKYLGYNLIFLNFLKPCIPFVFENNPGNCAVNGSLWTLKVEIMFYVFVPFLFYFLKSKTLKNKNFILFVLYIFSVLYSFFVGKYINDVMAKQFPGVLSYFLSGILLYVNLDFFKEKTKYFLAPAIILGVLELYFLNFTLLLPISISILIIWFAYSRIPFHNFGKYGDFSYGLYLVHYPIIQIFVKFGVYEKFSFAGFFLSVIITIFLSVLIWKFVEKPILDKKIK